MPSELLTTAIVTVLDLLTTYLLHSTLLFVVAALATWCCRTQSHALTERLWKSAAVIPLLTVPLQLLSGIGNPVFSPRWVEPVAQVSIDVLQTDVPDTLTVDESEPLAAADEPLVVDVDVAPIGAPSEWFPADVPSVILPIEVTVEAQIASMPPPNTAEIDVALTAPAAIVSITPSMPIDSQPLSAAAPTSRPRFMTWLTGLVVLIVTVGSLRFIVTGQRFRRRIQKFRTVDTGPVRDALGRVIRRSSLRRRVRLLETDDVGEPIAFGIRQWTIAVPRGIETQLNHRELEALLTHELAHLVRGDAWWLLIGRLLCGCLPFQPLNFVARNRWRQAAEFQCDDWAADRTGNPLSLAHCLTRVAEWRLDAASCAHALHTNRRRCALLARSANNAAGPV